MIGAVIGQGKAGWAAGYGVPFIERIDRGNDDAGKFFRVLVSVERWDGWDIN